MQFMCVIFLMLFGSSLKGMDSHSGQLKDVISWQLEAVIEKNPDNHQKSLWQIGITYTDIDSITNASTVTFQTYKENRELYNDKQEKKLPILSCFFDYR